MLSSSRTRPPPRSTLFPYTTLFRSAGGTGRSSGEGSGGEGGRSSSEGGQGGCQAVSSRCARGASRRQEGRCRSGQGGRSEEHTSELQSPYDLVCRLLLEKKKKKQST